MRKLKFTLIEVIIATLTLALSATIAVEMTSSAHLSTFNAESEWSNEHLLSLGAEFHLLFGHDAEMPDILPEDFAIECEINPATILDDEDEEKYEANSGWVLGEYTIILLKLGEEVERVTIDKLVPEDLFQ
jgi:hypothetical protein